MFGKRNYIVNENGSGFLAVSFDANSQPVSIVLKLPSKYLRYRKKRRATFDYRKFK